MKSMTFNNEKILLNSFFYQWNLKLSYKVSYRIYNKHEKCNNSYSLKYCNYRQKVTEYFFIKSIFILKIEVLSKNMSSINFKNQ